MSGYPKPAWKFKAWTEAMLRGATVGDPEYKGKRAKSTGSKTSRINRKKRRRRRKRKHAKE